MRNRDIQVSNFVGDARGANGYLKDCRYCCRTIYMHCGRDNRWRPFESWQAGNAAIGEFVLHQCRPDL